jgi:hypothetical protein
MGMIYRIDHGPVQKQSLKDIYQGQPLCPQARAIEIHKTLCPKKGNMFIQQDHEKIFLKPTRPSIIPNHP